MSPRQQLEVLSNQNLLRTLVPGETPSPLRIVRDGREMWNFASNDYLGLASHPAIASALHNG